MNGGMKLFVILLAILSIVAGAFSYLTLQNSKENEKVLLEAVTELKSNNDEFYKANEELKKKNSSLQTEIEKIKQEVNTIQDKNKQLEKDKIELKTRLEARAKAKKEEQRKFQLAMQNNQSTGTVSSSKDKTNPTTSPTPKTNGTNSGNKTAYLTFDDGPSINTIRILDTLKANNIKATFFVNGKTSSDSIGIYQRIVNEGHAIGNHTYSHEYSYIYKNKVNFFQDVDKLNALLESKVGITTKLFRFPGGSNNTVSHKYGSTGLTKEIAAELKSRGYVYFDWNVDSTDASVSKQSKEKIVKNVLSNSTGKNSAIILMHDSKPKTTTADALQPVIDGLKERGFKFDKLSTNSFAPQFIK